MLIWKLCRLAVIGLLLIGLAAMMPALAAVNTIPVSGKLDTTVTLTVQHLKPQDCNSLPLTTYLLSPGGSFRNDGASALVLGVAGYDDIKGGGGNDCLVGGSGGDDLAGGGGGDICFGTTATTFRSCAASYTTLRP
jgi:Ca2+-binding RTX toxin-like protein